MSVVVMKQLQKYNCRNMINSVAKAQLLLNPLWYLNGPGWIYNLRGLSICIFEKK